MRKLVIGILAHVDAGKTTLSESLLYSSGKIQKLGRVDNKNAYLDTHDLEKERGITIFSKQAVFEVEDTIITLLDTPGHMDFSSEMERTLQVIDIAILVISGADGIQSHTVTLWRLLTKYRIPVFIFVNKMDQIGTDRVALMKQLKEELDDRCTDFCIEGTELFFEQLALCDETMLEQFLEHGSIDISLIKRAINKRRIYPCYFGSALKLDGVEEFLRGIIKYSLVPNYPEEFGAKVFKISRDEQGNRLTHLKITGGILRVRNSLTNGVWEEKVNQIRIYSGQKYETVTEIGAGSICVVTGLSNAKPGDGFGIEKSSYSRVIEPVLSYRALLPAGVEPQVMLPKLKQIEEEEPELQVTWDENLQEIQVQIMGEVQIEILQSMIERRFGVNVHFDEGQILYKETIVNPVEGVGHFEPLRHYAEVHLLLEPGEPGSGLVFTADCSEDVLAIHWQRLILSYLEQKIHKGVLTGSPITDMKITLVSGRAHIMHTDSGDFREATYRAVRQGLKEAESVLLEPYYAFRLEIPERLIGRAMTDIDRMQGTYKIAEHKGEMAVIVGSAPVVTIRNYHREVLAYTRGLGRLSLSFEGYKPCHNAEEVIKEIGYDSERDPENPTGSIFCAHGSSYSVDWDEVKKHMHLDSYLNPQIQQNLDMPSSVDTLDNNTLTQDDSEDFSFLERAVFANKGKRMNWNRKEVIRRRKAKSINDIHYQPKEEYLLVDGYNIIHAWPELKELVDSNLDAARTRLLDLLCSYQGIRKNNIIVVFDAYRVEGHLEEIIDYHNIHVVFTKEKQTADQFIEKFGYDHQSEYEITVATSDGLQQLISIGTGSALLSARELKQEVENALKTTIQDFQNRQRPVRMSLKDTLSQENLNKVEELKSEKMSPGKEGRK